jgi:hypothetical protein
MNIVLHNVYVDTQQYHIVPAPDGALHCTMTILMAWIADIEEQLMIAGVHNYSCPMCMTTYHGLDTWNGPVKRAKSHAMEQGG